MSFISYKVLSHKNPLNLSELVGKYLDRNWTLQGGVSTCQNSFKIIIYSQAVIKEITNGSS